MAYRNRPSALKARSRGPDEPSTTTPAAASPRVSVPSGAMSYRDTAPSPKLVPNAYRPSWLSTAQHSAVRPLPTDRETGVNAESLTMYEDTADRPGSPPNASVTTSTPAGVKPNPYGVTPDAGWLTGSPSDPEDSTGKVRILSAPRSVTTKARPSGLKPTWAGLPSGSHRRISPDTGDNRPPSVTKPLRDA